jgi:hypothetical protein
MAGLVRPVEEWLLRPQAAVHISINGGYLLCIATAETPARYLLHTFCLNRAMCLLQPHLTWRARIHRQF